MKLIKSDKVWFAVAWCFIVCGVLGLIYLAWLITSQWNYSISYEPMVKSTVCEMVKPENLIKECKKKGDL